MDIISVVGIFDFDEADEEGAVLVGDEVLEEIVLVGKEERTSAFVVV